ncbi:MAG: KGK domain-containing protein [Microcoleaceae cyanobacterium MO_207.B10]|nr:KGK domain-containing protein [Microcoleaceae cyanobacterium MO_207.B10]
MEAEVILLNNDDVLSTSASLLMFQCTFKVSEYITMILARLESENLFEEGIECQLLKPGYYWKKGKIKLRLEFYKENSDNVSQTELSDNRISSFSQPSTAFLEVQEDTPQNVGMWS